MVKLINAFLVSVHSISLYTAVYKDICTFKVKKIKVSYIAISVESHIASSAVSYTYIDISAVSYTVVQSVQCHPLILVVQSHAYIAISAVSYIYCCQCRVIYCYYVFTTYVVVQSHTYIAICEVSYTVLLYVKCHILLLCTTYVVVQSHT